MKKCFIYGNCQTIHLKSSLAKKSEFTSIYETITIKRAHLLSQADIPDLEREVAAADLFIHQNVSDNYRGFPELGTNYLKSKLKSDCKVISFPVAYFTGYMPEMIYVTDKDSKKLADSNYPYHDFNILESFYQGKTVTETSKLITGDNFYSSQYINSNLDYTLAELARRESHTDICLSWFVKKYYQKTRLFHTFNHPTKVIINYLTNEILKLLDLSSIQEESWFFQGEEIIELNYYPIYPAVAKILKLDFAINPHYKIRNQSFSVPQMIAKFYLFYDQNPELVKFNINKYRDKYNRCKMQSDSRKLKANLDTTVAINTSGINLIDIDFTHVDTLALTNNLLDLVKKLQTGGLPKAAFHICQAVVDLNPMNVMAWQQLATLNEAEGQLELAIDCYKKMLEIKSNIPSVYINIARLYQGQNQYKKAIAYYNSGIEIKPEQPAWVYRFLGSALKEDAKFDRAIASYQKAMQIEPNYPAIFDIELGNILVEQKLYLEAIPYFQKALEQNPRLAEKTLISLPDLKAKVSTALH